MFLFLHILIRRLFLTLLKNEVYFKFYYSMTLLQDIAQEYYLHQPHMCRICTNFAEIYRLPDHPEHGY